MDELLQDMVKKNRDRIVVNETKIAGINGKLSILIGLNVPVAIAGIVAIIKSIF